MSARGFHIDRQTAPLNFTKKNNISINCKKIKQHLEC